MAEKREIKNNSADIAIADLILIAVLLAAGTVLRFVASSFTILGMKPNFMIAMYCLAIIIIRPKVGFAAIIGIIAGVLCQLSTPAPFLNLGSELIGAIVCGLLIKPKMQISKFDVMPAVATFVGTVFSGSSFVVGRVVFYQSELSALAAYVPIVLCTAIINTIIVCILYVPLKKAVNR